jgi:hypothetical protein
MLALYKTGQTKENAVYMMTIDQRNPRTDYVGQFIKTI